jgi:hypothetical protein
MRTCYAAKPRRATLLPVTAAAHTQNCEIATERNKGEYLDQEEGGVFFLAKILILPRRQP